MKSMIKIVLGYLFIFFPLQAFSVGDVIIINMNADKSYAYYLSFDDGTTTPTTSCAATDGGYVIISGSQIDQAENGKTASILALNCPQDATGPIDLQTKFTYSNSTTNNNVPTFECTVYTDSSGMLTGTCKALSSTQK